MSFVAGWISNIIIFVLLAIVIDMLLPSSSFQKYTKMVIGLLLIAIIITPILRLFQSNFDDVIQSATIQFNQENENQLGILTESKKKEIQAVQAAYILEQLADQLKGEVEEELINNYQMEMEITDIAVKKAENPKLPEDLQSISIVLTESKGKKDTVDAIAKINIDTQTPLESNETENNDIKKFLAKTWSIDEEMIHIVGERGHPTIEK